VATPPSLVKPKDTHADIVAKSKVPVDIGAEVAVQGKGPIDSCVDVAVKSKVLVDRGADVTVQGKGPIDSCVDVAVESKVPVDRGAEVAVQGKGPIDSFVDVAVESKVPVAPGASVVVNGNVPSDIGHEFAFKNDGLIDKDAEVAVKSQKRARQLWLNYIVRGNNEFQHFHAKKKCEGNCEKCTNDCECETCLKVKKLVDHKKQHKIKENPETNACRDCQLVIGIRHYHKRVCPIVDCLFCRSIKENENVDLTQACASPVSQDETITDVITQITEGTKLKIGEKFIQGVHYQLEDKLGQGGNGVVFGVELLEAGCAKLGSKRDIRLAAKRANVSDSEIMVSKQLADVSNVAPHYFVVNKHEHIHWVNKRTRKVERKVFEHLLFMQRAEMSLKDYLKKLPGFVLPVKDASIYFRQIVQAIKYAHSQTQSITHNDIKAGNVLMFRGTGESLYVAHLCDFEFAIRNGDAPERRGGTKFFMPPEREDGPGRDIHALGIFFLELTIGFSNCPLHKV
ncbi:serine threonine kinase, partial [Paramuricea clavata]